MEPALQEAPLPKYIAIEGPIGVGKTTLAHKIAETFNYDVFLEQPAENPFLKSFYRNPKQSALATQLFFLFQRMQQIEDLKQRGLLEDTLVIWGGEFGRGSYSQGTLTETNYGRDHHPKCFTIFMAGAGIKKGITIGSTDDFGYNIKERPVHIHDLQATLMHLLGIDHERLTFKHQGRRYRLTDVHGSVVKEILS